MLIYINADNTSYVLFYVSIFAVLKRYHIKTGPRPGPWTYEKTDYLKNGSVRKTGPKVLKPLPFVSFRMKDNVKVIHFHIKSRSVHGLVFVQIKLKSVPQIYIFKTVKLVKNSNCQFVVLTVMKRFRMFTHFHTALLSIKTCFYETSNVFYSRSRLFSQTC